MVAAALLTSAAVEAARDMILLRSAYWLDHELGHYILENGVPPRYPRRGNAPGRRRTRTGACVLASPSFVPLFDAPFTPVFLFALFALNRLSSPDRTVCAGLLILLSLLLSAVTSRAEAERIKSSERLASLVADHHRNAQFAGALGLARGAADSWKSPTAPRSARLLDRQAHRVPSTCSLALYIRIPPRRSRFTAAARGLWCVVNWPRARLSPPRS